MKQGDLFGKDFIKEDQNNYTKKITGPVYEPKNKKPHVLELVNNSKYNRLIHRIKTSNVSEDEKKFLITAAARHLVFNYSKIADYYAHADKEMQELMEHSALIIIDFNKAYEYGYLQLADDIANIYFDENHKDE